MKTKTYKVLNASKSIVVINETRMDLYVEFVEIGDEIRVIIRK